MTATFLLIPRAAPGALTCAVGSDGAVMYTADEGGNWSCQHLGAETGPANISFYGVAFSNVNQGWAVGASGDPRIFHTADGGQTWQTQFHWSNNLYDVSFPNSSNGWATGIRGSVLHTSNGGNSWTPQFTRTDTYFWGISFVDNLNGWVAGDYGVILHTADGGATWEPQRSCTTNRLWDVFFLDALNGWAAGNAGTIIHTNDGGIHWTVQDMKTSDQIDAIHFTDALNGWAMGTSIWHTGDGGATWSSQIIDLRRYTLNDIAFSDPLHGWAVADYAILYTTDGGVNWLVEPTSERLHAIATIPEPASLALLITLGAMLRRRNADIGEKSARCQDR